MSFQTITIAGNLGGNPEVRQTNAGDPVANFSVAVSDRKDETTWFRCIAFKQSADFVGKYLTKGSKVIVHGRMQEREWTTQDGEVRKAWELVANTVRSIGGKQDSAGDYERHAKGADGATSTSTDLDDKIPF